MLFPGAAQHLLVVRRRPGIVTGWNGPGSATHHFVLRCARDK